MRYETEGNTFMLGFNLAPAEATRVFVNLAYTDTTASFDTIQFSEPAHKPGRGDYDYTEVNDYSDLDIGQLDLTLTALQDVTEMFSLSLGGAYRVYDDNEVYLFDGSGDLWVVNAGAIFSF